MTCYKNMLLNLKKLIHDHNQTNDCFLREVSSPLKKYIASIYIVTGYAYILDMCLNMKKRLFKCKMKSKPF